MGLKCLMINILLIASSGQRVGKTYLANELVSRKLFSERDGFAIYIKKLSYDIHQNLSYINLTKDEFYQDKKDDKILNGKSPRDLVCDFSDLAQKFYGSDVWAEIIGQDAEHKSAKDSNYRLVVDDWRREIESDYFKDKPQFNIIKVYLDIADKKSKPSKTSLSYEGQIDPKSCHIHFTYDKNYSNFEQLIELIEARIV